MKATSNMCRVTTSYNECSALWSAANVCKYYESKHPGDSQAPCRFRHFDEFDEFGVPHECRCECGEAALEASMEAL